MFNYKPTTCVRNIEEHFDCQAGYEPERYAADAREALTNVLRYSHYLELSGSDKEQFAAMIIRLQELT
jgi:hypothetical protein